MLATTKADMSGICGKGPGLGSPMHLARQLSQHLELGIEPSALSCACASGVLGISTKYGEALLAVKYRITTPDGDMAGVWGDPIKNGTCKVIAKTVVRTSKPNTWLKYVVVDSFGNKSAVKTAKTEANKIAILTDHWDVPNAPGLDAGWVQIAGTAPIFISDREVYQMNCIGQIGDIKS